MPFENYSKKQLHELEMYLDGMLSASDRKAFLEDYDPTKLKQTQVLQNRIDDSLRAMFQQPSWDPARAQELTRKVFQRAFPTAALDELKPTKTAKLRGNASVDASRRLTLAVLAASMLALISGGSLFMSTKGITAPAVPNRSVASLYQETVKAGFRPYYNCEDLQRFTNTFRFRLGKSVQLADSEMPEGTRMLGLSYLGGTSRQSTAMLGEVDGQQVIVFVDRDGLGQPDITTEGTDGLNVFVVERNGLVFAEVSPLEEARMIQYLKVLDD